MGQKVKIIQVNWLDNDMGRMVEWAANEKEADQIIADKKDEYAAVEPSELEKIRTEDPDDPYEYEPEMPDDFTLYTMEVELTKKGLVHFLNSHSQFKLDNG